MDLHPKVRNNFSFHHLVPGYNYSLQDPQDGFYNRETVSFQANTTTYDPKTQATINISGDGAFLDTDNSHIQCIITYPLAQFTAANIAGAAALANSDMGGYVMDQLASSIVRRLQVKCGGQTLVELSNFADYHHIKMLTQDDQCAQMDYFSETVGYTPTLASPIDYRPETLYSAAELQKFIPLYGSSNLASSYDTDTENLDELIAERLKEDIKRAMKCWKLGAVIGNDSGATNLNCFYAPRANTEMGVYKVLLKLSDIPCFSSKQYFPMFALAGKLQLQIDWNDFLSCHHLIGFERGTAVPVAAALTYSIYKLEAVCNFIYPKPDFIERYMIDVIAKGEGFFKSEYVDWNTSIQTTNSANLLYNVSLARLNRADFIKKELGVGAGNGIQNVSSKRYTLIDTAVIGGVQYRGNKWYSPFGSDVTQITTKVNGITYPNASGSVLINEFLIKEQTEQAIGKLLGLKDPRRYFFDQQVLSFNYKKDTHSSPLQDVSGLNTANNNQIQFLINNSTAINVNQQPIIHGFFHGDMVVEFTISGALLLFR